MKISKMWHICVDEVRELWPCLIWNFVCRVTKTSTLLFAEKKMIYEGKSIVFLTYIRLFARSMEEY
jgi:hypothetical protein